MKRIQRRVALAGVVGGDRDRRRVRSIRTVGAGRIGRMRSAHLRSPSLETFGGEIASACRLFRSGLDRRSSFADADQGINPLHARSPAGETQQAPLAGATSPSV